MKEWFFIVQKNYTLWKTIPLSVYKMIPLKKNKIPIHVRLKAYLFNEFLNLYRWKWQALEFSVYFNQWEANT